MLGFATAIGCIAYEKIVHALSYPTLLIFIMMEYILIRSIGIWLFPGDVVVDYHKLLSTPSLIMWAAIYIASGITGLLWYWLTRKSGVMVGSIYEVKYIVIMAVLYIMFGDSKFTLDTAIGVGLALASIYFISK